MRIRWIGVRPFEYNVLAAALNDHFADEGQDHQVPYWS